MPESPPRFGAGKGTLADAGAAASVSQRGHLLPLPERTDDPAWLLIEEGFSLAREHEVASLFSIANGYFGNHGSLGEDCPLSAPGTFVAGVFEHGAGPGALPAIALLPGWADTRVWVEGKLLCMAEGEILEHRRVLDLRSGMLWREWRHRDLDGRITYIVLFRLASLADKHLLMKAMFFKPENYTGMVRVENTIELAPNMNVSLPTEAWKKRGSAMRPNVLPLVVKTPGSDIVVAFAAASQLLSNGPDPGKRDTDFEERRISERFELEVEIDADYRLDSLVAIYTSRDVEEPLKAAVAHVTGVLPGGIDSLLAAHKAAWQSRWETADVQIEGDYTLQQALRFALYHLIAASNPEDEHVSIGARALTGVAYMGHVFWDTEIYMVPFYTFTHPPSARALLMYRYYTLPAAREKARALGFRGAMYAWESADTGEETTPRYVSGPDSRVIPLLNAEMEIHVTADVAYAVWQYWDATADEDFFLSAGAEIMLETARLWASRGQIEEDGQYHIRHVIGPDEYHENVDDNAYTNLMARWNLRHGALTATILARRWPKAWQQLCHRLQISEEELNSWSRLAELMYTGFDPATKVFEQFSGYYEREPVDLAAYEPRTVAMDAILGHEAIQRTNVVKQADVIMAIYLLWDEFPPEVREANFRYYERRTGHGSSLSPSIHALVAARLRDLPLAEKYLRQAAEIDLANNMGNAAGGVHAAAIGGLWQAVVFGFAGVSLGPEGLIFDPYLLPDWRRLAFPVRWRGHGLRLSAEPEHVQVLAEGSLPGLKLVLGGEALWVTPPKQLRAERIGDHWGPWREVVEHRVVA